MAQLEYKLVASEHGLVIRLKGFNHKLPVRRSSLRIKNRELMKMFSNVFYAFEEISFLDSLNSYMSTSV